MHIENMKAIEETLASKIKAEFDNGIECINTEEMGAAVDMLKDIEEALYHATVTKAMDEYSDNESEYSRRYYDNYRYANGRFAPKGRGTYRRGYEEPPYYHVEPTYRMTADDYREWEHNRDMDKYKGKLYFSEPIMSDGNKNMNGAGVSESRYDARKRAYTETKEAHKANTPEDKQARMRDLEFYMQELTSDITDMIKDMSAEEKQLAKQKISVLATKL